MTDQEILEKAMQKAKSNGWSGVGLLDIPESFIYDHDFACALWPTSALEKRWIPKQEITRYDSGTTYTRPRYFQTVGTKNRGWQWHLQQMVIADDPIAYLGQHI